LEGMLPEVRNDADARLKTVVKAIDESLAELAEEPGIERLQVPSLQICCRTV
jgi:hypothetical protein